MKNSYLLFIASILPLFVASQCFDKNLRPKNIRYSEPSYQVIHERVSNCNSVMDAKPFSKSIGGHDLEFIPLGQGPNAFDFSGNPITSLWADSRINTVVFVHTLSNESDPNGCIAYDVSTQKGKPGSWTTNIKVYDSEMPGEPFEYGVRPQCGIYNPPGNHNPDSAYFVYFVPTWNESHAPFYHYAYGVNRLTNTNPSESTQNTLDSPPNVNHLTPSAFTLKLNGEAWCVDKNLIEASGDFSYSGELIVNKGTFNPQSLDYDFEQFLLPALSVGDYVNDVKVAFSVDNQIGYICLLSDSESDPQPFTQFHPILYKTIDGGETWDGPIHIQLGGIGGFEEVKEFVSDQMLDQIFGVENWHRDSISYNMGYHLDMVVDREGWPHITGLIAVADNEGWYPAKDAMATFHIYYTWGNDLHAELLYENLYFEGHFGDLTFYNRPQISINTEDSASEAAFVTWLDTDFEGIEENHQPDIFCSVFDFSGWIWGYNEPINVTEFTDAWLVSWMGSQSHYVLDSVYSYWSGMYDIPLVYQEINPINPYDETQFWYIYGWNVWWLYENVKSIKHQKCFIKVTPNPFSSEATIQIKLYAPEDLDIIIFNQLGQVVHYEDIGKIDSDVYEFTFDGSSLEPGVYFITAKAGDFYETEKMVLMN